MAMTDPNAPEQERAQLTARARTIAGERVGGLRLKGGVLTVAVDVAGLDADARAALEAKLVEQLSAEPGVLAVRVAMVASRAARTLIAVGSGKGGVGKSTLAVNLALALATLGKRVGMVDADIYGPSQPHLLGTEGIRPDARDNKLVPVMSAFGVPVLSMGQIVEPGQAIAWRGPMAGKALDQLIDAQWGDCDTLIVDLPPGTGDVQLSILAKYKPAGAVIVSTPQDLALIDAARAITLFTDAGVPIIGMVENMAGYACPHCGEVSDPFGRGGAAAEAARLGLDLLGSVPLDRSIRLASDAGVPPVAQRGDIAQPYLAIAARVAAWLDARA